MSCPWKQVSDRRLPPLPGNSSQEVFSRRSCTPEVSICVNDVKSYLYSHPCIIQEHVTKHFQLSEVQTWYEQRPNSKLHLEETVSKRKCQSQGDCMVSRSSSFEIIKSVNNAVQSIGDHSGVAEILFSSATIISSNVKADEYFLFMVGSQGQDLLLCREVNGRIQESLFGPCQMDTSVAAYTACSKQGLLCSDILGDDRFPIGIGMNSSSAKSVISIPVIQPNQMVPAVMLFVRNYESPAFNQCEYQIASVCLMWMAIAMEKVQACKGLVKQREFNSFLLDVSRVIFDDAVTLDTLTEHIMMFAKSLVNADRCAFFLVDAQTEELYADLFDEGREVEGKPVFTKKNQIRFSTSKGIGGYVAKTGEVVNIPDAYSDARFNREVDVATGYTTRNILCMPIISRGIVIGVVQMINKRSSPHVFDQNDEANFSMFAIYCALALHYSKIYSTIQQSERVLSVLGEQLQYYSMSTNAEGDRLLNRWHKQNFTIPPSLENFDFDCKTHERILPELLLHMIHNLFGPDLFDLNTLARFFLTVRKNYRAIQFHNFIHACMVAQCMYYIIRQNTDLFTEMEKQALFFACLCHDIDHQAKTNVFLRKYDSKLGALYSTGSIMEQHHFNHLMSILSQDSHNIFGQLPQNIYKQVIGLLKQLILSTDLVLSFGNKHDLEQLVQSGAFDLNNSSHRSKFFKLMMTVCDLCAISKLWPVHRDMVENIYSEFYAEGDEDKKRGGQPIPLFDRDNAENQSQEQVDFIRHVVLPNMELLAEILPCVAPMVEGAKDNLAQWQREGAGQSTAMWAVSP